MLLGALTDRRISLIGTGIGISGIGLPFLLPQDGAKPYAVALVVIGLVVAAYGLAHGRRRRKVVAIEPELPDLPLIRPAEAPERTFIEETPDSLSKLFSPNLTTMQAKRVAEPFIGKWLRVTGELDDAQDFESFVQVTLKGSRPTYLYLYFSRDRDRLNLLRPGQLITVAGKIKDFSSNDFHLDDCELVADAR